MKKRFPDAQPFGEAVIHETSANEINWHPLDHGGGGAEIVESDEELEIRLPEQPRVFIRSRLADEPATTD